MCFVDVDVGVRVRDGVCVCVRLVLRIEFTDIVVLRSTTVLYLLVGKIS